MPSVPPPRPVADRCRGGTRASGRSQPEGVLGCRDERGARRIALVRPLRHRPAEHRVDAVRELAVALLRARRLVLEMRPRHREDGAAPERRLAGQALIEEAAERVDVGSTVDGVSLELLGGEVRASPASGRRPAACPARRNCASGRSPRGTRARPGRAGRWTASDRGGRDPSRAPRPPRPRSGRRSPWRARG